MLAEARRAEQQRPTITWLIVANTAEMLLSWSDPLACEQRQYFLSDGGRPRPPDLFRIATAADPLLIPQLIDSLGAAVTPGVFIEGWKPGRS